MWLLVVALAGPLVAQDPGDGLEPSGQSATLDEAVRTFHRAMAAVHAPIDGGDEDHARETMTARIARAVEIGTALMARDDAATLTVPMLAELLTTLAQLQLAAGDTDTALEIATRAVTSTASPRDPAAWPRDTRRWHLLALTVRIRIRLHRFTTTGADADLAEARVDRKQLEELDPQTAEAVVPQLFPPLLPGEEAPSFELRAGALLDERGRSALQEEFERRQLPAAAVRAIGQGRLELDHLRRVVVVVAFWSTAHPGSEALARGLGGLLETHPDAPLVVATVNVDDRQETLAAALSGIREAPTLPDGRVVTGFGRLPRLLAYDGAPNPADADPATRPRVRLLCRRVPWVLVIDRGGRIARIGTDLRHLPAIRDTVGECIRTSSPQDGRPSD